MEGKKVQCRICNHFCIIGNGKKGICNVRENQDGRLVSLVLDRVIASSVDPIEKKPIFHLKPGSYSYSIATVGCNFKCQFCQNSDIAQMPSDRKGMIQGKKIQPETIVEQALANGCQSIAYTYTEPTVFFELAYETAKLARENGLSNIFVTNGYMSTDLIKMITPFLDAVNVDLKAFDEKFYQTYCQARLGPVKENLVQLKQAGILVEVTTLLIPGLNDDPDDLTSMARFLVRELGPETPWHISRFHPSYKMMDRSPTRVSSLERVFDIGKKAGMHHVYTGNVPGLLSENTKCQVCDTTIVKRHGYTIENYLKENGTCPQCDAQIYGIY
ncbi:MAG: AmmeMemoRadiSam system radical SAM enzyme [Desulfobacteraceae bacterium 4572_89]|nr:MAG: AmmeMemoRadiSam system radical SAM enzyme [Desulfobacteraceae bacterium 4572_89]